MSQYQSKTQPKSQNSRYEHTILLVKKHRILCCPPMLIEIPWDVPRMRQARVSTTLLLKVLTFFSSQNCQDISIFCGAVYSLRFLVIFPKFQVISYIFPMGKFKDKSSNEEFVNDNSGTAKTNQPASSSSPTTITAQATATKKDSCGVNANISKFWVSFLLQNQLIITQWVMWTCLFIIVTIWVFWGSLFSPVIGQLSEKCIFQIQDHLRFMICTLNRWPGLRKDVSEYCRSCHMCQMVGKPKKKIPSPSLKLTPAFDELFSRVMIDCIGPLSNLVDNYVCINTISWSYNQIFHICWITSHHSIRSRFQFYIWIIQTSVERA